MNWDDYLHNIRKKEIEAIKNFLSTRKWKNGLEVGAGDGYQTTLLYEFFENFYSSDFNFGRIKEENKINKVNYFKADAENIDKLFTDKKFDLIFSSNLLEHLPDPNLFLKNSLKILNNDGVMIAIIPNRFWKITHTVFYYPHLSIIFVKKIKNFFIKNKPPHLDRVALNPAARIFTPKAPGVSMCGGKYKNNNKLEFGNNLKSDKKNRKNSKIREILLPRPHGSFDSNSQELIKYGKKQWSELFLRNGYSIKYILKGPVASGFNMGNKNISVFLEKMGFCSIYIFIINKQ